MRLSSARMPRWWRSLWRRRYPMGLDNFLIVRAYTTTGSPRDHRVRGLGCGCGYRVYAPNGDRIGRDHYPTLGGAVRAAHRHAVEQGWSA